MREFDAATILWRTEQGDLAGDFRKAALRALFEACFARVVAHEEEPAQLRPVDEIIHPWLIRLCAVFLDQGTAYWPMPNRERGFYESVRMLLAQRGGVFPRYLAGLDDEFQRQQHLGFSASRCGPGLPGRNSITARRSGQTLFSPSCWHCLAGRA